MTLRCGEAVEWTLDDACAVSVQQILSDAAEWRAWTLPQLPPAIKTQLLQQLRDSVLMECRGGMQ